MRSEYKKYLRYEKLPHRLCPGCGHGIIQGSIVRILYQIDAILEKYVFVTGIGCAANIVNQYINADTFHVTHGRTIAFATGIKIANPNLEVVVVSGDGDLISIGGNHFIHAARRNINITVICANNYIYGTTGGQVAATTPLGAYTATSPRGNTEKPFDLSELSLAAGAKYYARCTVGQPKLMDKYIKRGIENEGFSFIEVVTTCPVQYGKKNNIASPGAMIKELKKRTIPKDKKSNISDLERKIVVGEWM